jgi:hypothetical protein
MSLLRDSLQQTPAGMQAIRLRAKNLLLDARSKGDNKNLSQVPLEKLQQAERVAVAPPVLCWILIDDPDHGIARDY